MYVITYMTNLKEREKGTKKKKRKERRKEIVNIKKKKQGRNEKRKEGGTLIVREIRFVVARSRV